MRQPQAVWVASAFAANSSRAMAGRMPVIGITAGLSPRMAPGSGTWRCGVTGRRGIRGHTSAAG
jgi:hypothetical protein